MYDKELAERIVGFLNELIAVDEEAVRNLSVLRTPCNRELADHPTVQVLTETSATSWPSDKSLRFKVGMIGILNGLCGVDDDGVGPITAIYTVQSDVSEDGKRLEGQHSVITRFEVVDTEIIDG